MAPKSKQQEVNEIESLRQITTDFIDDVAEEQKRVWASMSIRVQGGYDRVQKLRIDWLEERVQKLATQESPVLWETLFGLLATAVPVAGIISWLMPHTQRSFNIH